MKLTNVLISQIKNDTTRYDSYLELFKICYPGEVKYTYNYLEWLYLDNPCGQAIGFDALVGDKVVAHYVVIPFLAVINNKKCLACWSLDTATHPDFQGLGFFIKLADLTFKLAEQLGYVAVIGIANKNSTYGFIKKLDFKLLGQMNTRFGYFKKISLSEEVGYRKWTDVFLQWRLNNPSATYYYKNFNDHKRIYAHTYPLNTPVILGCCSKNIILSERILKLASSSYLRPSFLISFNYIVEGININLPKKVLPSPWNLIYRALNDTAVVKPSEFSICSLDSDTF